jgi:hypothetical protein
MIDEQETLRVDAYTRVRAGPDLLDQVEARLLEGRDSAASRPFRREGDRSDEEK